MSLILNIPGDKRLNHRARPCDPQEPGVEPLKTHLITPIAVSDYTETSGKSPSAQIFIWNYPDMAVFFRKKS